MESKIGIGVIGMGWMGQVHSRAYRQVPLRFPDAGIEPRLVMCADEVPARAGQAGKALGFERSTTDWLELVEHPEVQVVNITAPNHMHLEMARASAANGKHIFCEKPVGRGPEETAQIEAAARRAGVLSFVGFNYRWAPLVVHAQQLIQQGRLGDVTHYRGRFLSMYGSNPRSRLTWRFDRNLGGYGALCDLMSHVVDMAHHLAGPVKRLVANRHTFIKQRPLPVRGQGTHYSLGSADDPSGEVTNEDYAGALVEFDNGARGTFEVSRTILGPKCEMAFELNGTQGAVGWNFERLNELDLYLPGEDGLHDGYTKLLAGDKHPYHGNFNPGDGNSIGYDDLRTIEAYEFLRSVVDGEQRQPGLSEALAVANVHSAMIRSWESGGWEDVASSKLLNDKPTNGVSGRLAGA